MLYDLASSDLTRVQCANDSVAQGGCGVPLHQLTERYSAVSACPPLPYFLNKQSTYQL